MLYAAKVSVWARWFIWLVCERLPPTGVRWRWPPTPPGPRTTEVAGAVRLMLCGQDDADCNRLYSARHSDPDVLRRRRRLRRPRTVRAATGPGHRSPLYRSSHLAARFALGLATGQEGATSTTSTAAPRSPASRSPTGWPRIRSFWRSATPCWSNSANWVWAIRCHLRGPRAGGDLRPRPGGVPPPDPHAPGTARPAHHRISQGHIQALALGLSRSSHQAHRPHGGQVSAPAVSRTGGHDAGGNCPRMPGRSLIKRARRRWRVGAWLMLDINSAIPWRETRMPVGGPVGNSACSQGRL